ncbi:unnamed protein product, partial [Choristocarpus tenellus]
MPTRKIFQGCGSGMKHCDQRKDAGSGVVGTGGLGLQIRSLDWCKPKLFITSLLYFLIEQACVYLEDPPVRSKRGQDFPRDMKLSILRWDTPVNEDSSRESLPIRQGSSLSNSVGEAHTIMDNGEHASSKSSAAGARMWGQGVVAEIIERDGAETKASPTKEEPMKKSSVDHCGPVVVGGNGAYALPVKEEMWMLCNLDDNLVISQFNPHEGFQVPPHARGDTVAPGGAGGVEGVGASSGAGAGARASSGGGGRGSRPSGVVHQSTNPNSSQEGDVSGSGRGQGQGSRARVQDQARGQQEQGSSSTAAEVVTRTRRDDRITFRARPTCHDFLWAWSRGRETIVTSGGGGGGGGGPSTSSSGLSSTLGSVKARGSRSEGGGGGVIVGGELSSLSSVQSSSSASSALGRSSFSMTGAGGAAPTAPLMSIAAPVPPSKSPQGPEKIIAVGFKSGECAVLDAMRRGDSRILLVLNWEGKACPGRVTAVRFVPGTGKRLLVVAYSTGHVYNFDTSLTEERPIGSAVVGGGGPSPS